MRSGTWLLRRAASTSMALADPLLPSAEPQPLIPWQIIFFANVFMACVSFSIVMPTLFLYLDGMNASKAFYAFVVAAFSVGEAIGSMALGAVSNKLGTKRTLQLCATLSFCGATLYGLGDLCFRAISPDAAPGVVLIARTLQGIGSGGQQAVEQAYLSVAAPPHMRTELTGKLSTFACLGFIAGPSFAALVSQTPDLRLGSLVFNSYTKQGWFVALLNVLMYLTSTCCFIEKVVKPPEEDGASRTARKVSGKRALAVWACIAIFFIHFNGFAVQETITTPLVWDWFGWSDFEANLLFVGAGVANLGCAVVMAALSSPRLRADGSTSQLVSDRTLLLWSLVLAAGGWLLMVPPNGYDPSPDVPGMSLPQFFLGFGLVTIAFPFGRGLCLSMVGKLLGDTPQGTWMGVMFALGAIARIAGPFWAVTGFYLFGSFAVFGSTAALMLVALAAIKVLWDDLEGPKPAAMVMTPGGGRMSQAYASPLFHPSQNIPSDEVVPPLVLPASV